MLQIAALIEVVVCWVIWIFAFRKPSREAQGQKKVARASASRWGIGLVAVSFALVWMYLRPVGFQKSTASLVVSMVLAPLATVLAWAAAHELGKQWRYEAAVTEDHELVQSGPYALVRHPIYLSMFLMLMATGAAYTWWPMWVAGAVFFILGTEIRVHAEERLLAAHFGGAFQQYRSRVRAYIPLVR